MHIRKMNTIRVFKRVRPKLKNRASWVVVPGTSYVPSSVVACHCDPSKYLYVYSMSVSFSEVTPCGFIDHHQRFGGMCCLCLPDRTYLLPPWCRVLLEKLTGLQLVKKFPAFHGTRRFITALTSVRHLSLSRPSPIQSIYPHPTSWRFILILSTHLCLGLPTGLFPPGFPTKTLYTPLS